MHHLRLLLLLPIFLFAQAKYTIQYDVTPECQKFTVPGSGSIYTVFHPATNQKDGVKAPLVFFLGGSEGGIWPIEEPIIQETLDRGYHVVTVGYFKMDGLPGAATRIALEPFGKAIAYYKKQPGVDPDRIGLVGVSKGGELALLLGSHFSDLRLIVGLVPSHVAFQGTDIAIFSHHSTWKYQGTEVPFVPYRPFSWAAIKGVVTGEEYLDMHREALENTEAVEKARFAVERINGPVLLLSAQKDQYWPSTAMSDAVMKRLDAHHFRYPHRHIAWETNHFVLAYPKARAKILDFIADQWTKPKARK